MRRLILAAAVFALLVVGVLVWWRGGKDDATAPSSSPSAEPARSANIAHAGSAARNAAPAPEAADDQPQQPIPVDPATAPSLDAPHSKPAPPQKAFTREETIEKREADLKLLDDTRVRLEADLATAKAAGNAADQRDLQVRLTRLAALRNQRVAELDALRAGGALPP